MAANGYPDLHTGLVAGDETLAHFRDSSLVSARDPSLPRVARFFLCLISLL